MDSIDPAHNGTTAIVQFDLNGPDAERVVRSIMHRVGSGYGVKLSVANAKILSQVLYSQAMQVQTLAGKCRSLEEQLYPVKMLEGTLPEVVKQRGDTFQIVVEKRPVTWCNNRGHMLDCRGLTTEPTHVRLDRGIYIVQTGENND